ncbi:MAG: hypothetical protein WCJ76_16520, partial [Comamonadaceae bacterium]
RHRQASRLIASALLSSSRGLSSRHRERSVAIHGFRGHGLPHFVRNDEWFTERGLACDRNIFESSALIALRQQMLLHFERTGGIVNSLKAFLTRNANGDYL